MTPLEKSFLGRPCKLTKDLDIKTKTKKLESKAKDSNHWYDFVLKNLKGSC